MPEVFNSGNGGYTCDCCSKLLWSGPSNVPRYTYAASCDSIVRFGEKYFCSEECVSKTIQLERKKNNA